MAADITDMFRKLAYRGTQTTLSGNGYNPGDTSATLANSANWQTETAICFSMLRKDSNGNEVTGSYTVWGAVLIGDTLTNLQLLFGSDQAYAPGGNTVVVMYVTAAQMNLLIDGILVSHTQTGELKNKIVTLAKLNGGSTQGLLKVGEDGVVSVGKAESDNVDSATFKDFPFPMATYTIGEAAYLGGAKLTRILNMVFLSMTVRVINAQGTTLTGNSNVIPVGFRPTGDVIFESGLINNNVRTGSVSRIIKSDGSVSVAATATDIQEFRGSGSWITNDAWPAS